LARKLLCLDISKPLKESQMKEKGKEISSEVTEIFELAIEDLANLARTFDMIGDLGSRGHKFDSVEFEVNEAEALVH
jgi:hypothetical protein